MNGQRALRVVLIGHLFVVGCSAVSRLARRLLGFIACIAMHAVRICSPSRIPMAGDDEETASQCARSVERIEENGSEMQKLNCCLVVVRTCIRGD
jgi:hypothetical protein